MRRLLRKNERQDILRVVQELVEKYDTSLATIAHVIREACYPDSLAVFRIPEEYKVHHYLPEEIEKFVYAIKARGPYRPCEVCDMVIEKFPDCNVDPKKLYLSVYHIMHKERRNAESSRWYRENKEEYLKVNRAAHERKKRIYEELKEANK